MKEFFEKNKVFLAGLLAAVAVAVQQFFLEPVVNYPMLGFAAGVAVLSYLSKNLRGQWMTITGILSTAVFNIYTTYSSGGQITWPQVIGTLITAYITVAIPAPKSVSYEKTEVIQEAKQEAKEIDASKTPPVDPPVGK